MGSIAHYLFLPIKFDCINIYQGKFKDTKGLLKNSKSKGRQYNGQHKKGQKDKE